MSIFFTADEHYCHSNIIKYCERPFSTAEEMDRKLINLHNEEVGSRDVVYHLGDFSLLGPTKKDKLKGILAQLNGVHHLVLGNHDRLKPFSYVEIGFQTVHTTMECPFAPGIVLAHDPSIATVLSRSEILICGHVHGLFKYIGNVFNAGVDPWGFKPIHLEFIKATMARDRKERKGAS